MPWARKPVALRPVWRCRTSSRSATVPWIAARSASGSVAPSVQGGMGVCSARQLVATNCAPAAARLILSGIGPVSSLCPNKEERSSFSSNGGANQNRLDLIESERLGSRPTTRTAPESDQRQSAIDEQIKLSRDRRARSTVIRLVGTRLP
jgi:hypothetical protein